MELQKARGEVEIRQLLQQIQEQEELLTEKQAQVEKLEGELETKTKTIVDINFEKSQLERDVIQYRTKLENAVKDKAATEQELKCTKLLFEQSEATWSLTQKKLEEKITNVEEVDFGAEAELHNVQSKNKDLHRMRFDSQTESDAQLESSEERVDKVLQQKLEELVQVQKKAEMAEEKAQSYKKLLDDSNNKVKKLQMDMESERSHTRQKSEELQQETLNLKKSIINLQEEIRSLQRAKSSFEQSSCFQSTEIEGLKEQLKITQGELQKKSSVEQENTYKINNLEEEVASREAVIDQLNLKCNELTRMNVSSGSDIRGLQIQTESLEKVRLLSDQKIKSLKREVESWRQQLQTSKEESLVIMKSEQALQLKCKNLEAELQKSEMDASQLQRKINELKQNSLEMEQNLKNTKAKLDQVLMETESKDQQIQIYKSQVEGTKSQIRIIEEELNKKSQTTYELQMKLQEFSDEAKKMTDVQQKTKSLSGKIANYEEEITTLKSELKSLFAEKSLVNQKVHMQKAEIDSLNEMLKKKNAELQTESGVNQNHISKIKALEDELFKHKHSFKGTTVSSEKVIENLKQDINTLQNDKTAAEKKLESLNVRIFELSSSLQKANDELAQEAKERKLKESKIVVLETELQKNNLTIKDMTSSSDKSRSNLQHENTILKREKSETLGKNVSLGTEVRMLKDKLQRAQRDAEQKQKENSALQSRSKQMEEQLDNCKKMLEELKRKLELQKEGYEKQLSLMQSEIEKKVILLRSEITEDSRPSGGAELTGALNKYLKQDVKLIQTVHQTTVGSRQQMDRELQMKTERLQQERTTLVQELSNAKTEIVQLEGEKVKLVSKISSLQSLCSQQSVEKTKFEKLLTDSERKLTLKENEARSLREQIELYIREVRSLQETLSTVAVDTMKISHQSVMNSKADLMKADPTTSFIKGAKYGKEDETLKTKEVWKLLALL